ncbi:MAG TPA: CsgG/HfaB family protein [Steroidobacteraceae bacterium]|jgi:curli biogenesis system outer membrane secretion channel CsgG
MNPLSHLSSILALGAALALSAQMARAGGDDPVVQSSKQSRAFDSLPPKPLEQRVPVTIYEFHSGVEGVPVGAATDIFTTALIESRQFRVVERNRLNQGVVYEKQLNGAGQATGDAAQHQLRGARYIFEGTVSEANPGADQKQGGVSIGGLSFGGGKNKDTIAVDVRILDANTGDVLDSVSVSKVLNDSSVGVGGTAAFASTLASMSGHTVSPLTPDVSYQTSHKESVDKALRACIETAVLALIKRVDLSGSN